MVGHRLRRQHVDEGPDRAAGTEVGLERGEQLEGLGRAVHVAEGRRDAADEEVGVLDGPLRAVDLLVPVEERLAAGIAAHDEDGAVGDVHSAAAVVVDPVAQGDEAVDRRQDVGQRPVVDRALQRVDEQVGGEPDVRVEHVTGRGAELGGRVGDAARRGWEAAAQAEAVHPLELVDGSRRGGLLGAPEQLGGLRCEAGVERRAGRLAQPPGSLGDVR